jgi:hypothetical protein
VDGTAQEDKKNGKAALPAAVTNFPLLLYAAAKTPKNGYKGRGPERSTTKPLHGTNHSHCQSISPRIHSHSIHPPLHQKPSTFPPTFPSTPLLQQEQIGGARKNPKNSLKNLKITR